MGLFNRAINLQDGFVKIPHSPQFNLTSSFTVMFWIKPVSNTSGTILQKGDNYNITLNSGHVVFGSGYWDGYSWREGMGYVSSVETLPNSQWSFIACKYTGTKLWIYINGILDQVVSASGHPISDTEDIYIGQGLVAALDELVILNQQLPYTKMIDYYLKQPLVAPVIHAPEST
jgi:hypothetical protein